MMLLQPNPPHILAFFGLQFCWLSRCHAFAPLTGQQHMSSKFVVKNSAASSSTIEESGDPLDELSAERKANLFQFLLRDLEVEQVPVLGVDATETHVFQAALWTTMGELSENPVEDRVCLVFESIPVETLKMFVQELDAIKTDSFLMDNIPELKRLNATLVGRGVGPAIVLTTSNRTNTELEAYQSLKQSAPVPNTMGCMAAMDSYITRTSSATGLVNYVDNRIIGSVDACDILSGFWTSVCELRSFPESEKASISVSYAPTTNGIDDSVRHNRYAALSILINRMTYLFGGKDLASIHTFPLYDRNAIPRQDERASMGHLSPPSDDDDEAATKLLNYVRRSPLPSIISTCNKDEIAQLNKEAELTFIQNKSQEELEEAMQMESKLISAFE
jgi:hypothetical protein